VNGLKYGTPFLVAAGFDYNGRLSRILPHVSFGGEEVGSVTAKPYGGNPKPRMSRLRRSQSIIVNKGLKNEGVEAVIKRLKSLPVPVPEARPRGRSFIIGISIARTNCAESAGVEEGIADYIYSFRRLNEENVGDYYTINISCPNSFGGEAFTTPALLERLLRALSAVKCSKPVYVKMPINLPWDKFHELLKIIDAHGLQGVVIGNLNKNYDYLDYRAEAPEAYAGGLSGKPCQSLSTELIRQTRKAYGSRFTIIGAGGVSSWEAAKEKFEAGADLIQLITGMIYEGPGLVKEMCGGYADHVEHGH